EETGCSVLSSDLYERGYGETGVDFLNTTRTADNIVTNPPYNCAEGFVASGGKHAHRKFALLLRLAFLKGANRANMIFTKTPPARVWVFSKRITFYPRALILREAARLLMRGLYGTRMRPAPRNSDGSNLDTGRDFLKLPCDKTARDGHQPSDRLGRRVLRRGHRHPYLARYMLS